MIGFTHILYTHIYLYYRFSLDFCYLNECVDNQRISNYDKKKEKEKEKKTKNDRKLNSFTGNELCSASLLITKHKEPQRQTNEEHCNKQN